jgi:hypothetical protein
VNYAEALVENSIQRMNDEFYRLMTHPPRDVIIPCVYGTMEKVLLGQVNTGVPIGKAWSADSNRSLLKYKRIFSSIIGDSITKL